MGPKWRTVMGFSNRAQSIWNSQGEIMEFVKTINTLTTNPDCYNSIKV